MWACPVTSGARSRTARSWPDTATVATLARLAAGQVPDTCALSAQLTSSQVAMTGGHTNRTEGCIMTADGTSGSTGHRTATGTVTAGAAIHPRFLRSGPWALSSVVGLLFGLSFATSYAALYDYALELGFSREFGIAFPLVLDAVIIVLAVTLLLERALGRRTVTIRGWRFTVRLPTWPMAALWIFFAGSVAGNVGHAPTILAAQLFAAVPPVSAALTFHLLLRLLDRAPALRAIAESYEERSVDEQERAAARKARRAGIKTGRHASVAAASANAHVSENGHPAPATASDQRHPNGDDERATDPPASLQESASSGSARAASEDELRRRVQAMIEAGETVTGEAIGQWLGLSARTGRRRLAALLRADPDLAGAVENAASH